MVCRQVEISGRNYVLENKQDLVTKRPAVREETSALLKDVYGLVPRYLLRYKLDRAASAATQQVKSSLCLHHVGCISIIILCSIMQLTGHALRRQRMMQNPWLPCLKKSAQRYFRTSWMLGSKQGRNCIRFRSFWRLRARSGSVVHILSDA
jgi:hypothetical protein